LLKANDFYIYTLTKKRISNIVCIFFVFVTIFISDDTLTFGTNANKLFIYIKYLIYLILIILMLIKFGMKTIVPQSTLYLFAIIITISSTALVNFDFRGGYGYQIMIIVLAYLITQSLNIKQFIEIFKKYILILTQIFH